MITIQDVAAEEDVVSEENASGHQEDQPRRVPEEIALTLAAAMAGGTVAQTPDTGEILKRLQTALNPSASAEVSEDKPSGPSVITVRIGDLTAGLIEKAGANGQTLAITHDRQLIGIVIPVTRGLVEFLIEQNMSRILYNIALSEKQIKTADKMTTLDEVLDQAAAAEAAPARPVLTAGMTEAGHFPQPHEESEGWQAGKSSTLRGGG
jgi:hypothetical protein